MSIRFEEISLKNHKSGTFDWEKITISEEKMKMENFSPLTTAT